MIVGKTMGQFLNSINEVRKNYTKFDEWEQRQADERAQKEHLAKTLEIPQDKVELTKKYAETIVRATEIMDAKSEDNCQDMEQLTGLLSIIPVLGIQFGQIPIMNWLDKKIRANYNKKIEKIDNEIRELYKKGKTFDDVKLQRDKHKSLEAKMYKASDRVTKYGPIVSIGLLLASSVGMILWGNSKQKEASRIGRYQAKQNELKELDSFVVYTPEQLEKAKEIAKSIPDEKERNSISKMIKELKDMSRDKKAYKEYLKNKDPKEIEKLKSLTFTESQLEKGREDKELIVDAVKEINIKAEEYSENVENSFDTLSTVSWLIAIPLGLITNKIMKMTKTSKKVQNIVSVALPILTTLGIQLTGTLEEKKASRVGRYKARQDILKNPARLMAFSDSDMESAKDIKAPKQKQGFMAKIGDSFSFLARYYKDKKEYNKYKKTTQKENEKLQKAFKQIEITDAQKQEAKALQKNVFRAFDEIDEMSQRYSEDVEAGTEIAKELGVSAWSIGSIVGTAYLAASIIKGKFPTMKIANKLANWTLDAKSPLKKAINDVYDVVNKMDKNARKEFQENLVRGDIKSYLRWSGSPELNTACENLGNEFLNSGIEGLFLKIATEGKNFNLSKALTEIFQNHFKQTPIAKGIRKIVAQSSKLWIKNKSSKYDVEIPKELQEQLGMNFTYKNYDALINTGIAAGLPVLGVIVGIPYAFNAWLTNIQKKAGKIGIMKAMDKIDDDRVFASNEISDEKVEKAQDVKLSHNTNLLKNIAS